MGGCYSTNKIDYNKQTSRLKDKAVSLLSSARDEDNKKNYSDASRLYEKGVLYALLYMHELKNKWDKDDIYKKCVKYLERAEELTDYLSQVTTPNDRDSAIESALDGASQSCQEISDQEIQLSGRGTQMNGSETQMSDTEIYGYMGGDHGCLPTHRQFSRYPSGTVQACTKYESKEQDRLWKKLKSAILQEKPNVLWSDVIGLERVKKDLQGVLLGQLKFPQLFTGNRTPWRRVLLCGLPGTGKTHLANALAATFDGYTYFSVSPSVILSKWKGESEKLVKILFQMAQEHQPSIIFIEDIDSLCCLNAYDECEAERRIKNEILDQIKGIGNDCVSIFATSNKPWIINKPTIKTFEKRICIPLPDEHARTEMFKLHLGTTPHSLTEEDFRELGKRSDGYSGADISIVVRDALMQPVRKVQTATHFRKVHGPSRSNPDIIVDDLLTPCSPGSAGAIEMSWVDVPGDKLLEPVVSMNDMKYSLSASKPTVNDDDLKKLKDFTDDFGQEG